MPFVSLSEKERDKDMAAIDPKKGHHIFNNALLSLLKDPIEKFIDEVLKPEGKTVIPKMVQDLIDNPIGNPNLEHYWEQKMTVSFKKTVENDKQVRFGWLISQLKENIYGCMVALWKKYTKPGVVFYERLIREYIHELIKDELYVDEEAMKKWTGSKQKITEVGDAAKEFLKSICYMDHAGENTMIPDIVRAFRQVNK